jgi:hypothetical protein
LLDQKIQLAISSRNIDILDSRQHLLHCIILLLYINIIRQLMKVIVDQDSWEVRFMQLAMNHQYYNRLNFHLGLLFNLLWNPHPMNLKYHKLNLQMNLFVVHDAKRMLVHIFNFVMVVATIFATFVKWRMQYHQIIIVHWDKGIKEVIKWWEMNYIKEAMKYWHHHPILRRR